MIIAKKKRSYANSIYKANFLLGSIIDIDSMKSEKMDTTQKIVYILNSYCVESRIILPIISYNCLYIDQGYKLLCTANN